MARKVTFAAPGACPKCGDTDVIERTYSWSWFTCHKCGKTSAYPVLSSEEIPDEAPQS